MFFSTEKSCKSFDEGKVIKMAKKWPPPNMCFHIYGNISAYRWNLDVNPKLKCGFRANGTK
jgi:hypothetical protein